MSVFNGRPYLEAAIRSVFAQTLQDFELIVVDDASTDETPDILARLAGEDSRLMVHRLAENSRIAAALNAGIALARAPLIARMDADDLCLPERLERQKAAMDADPDLVMLGASIEQIDTSGRTIRVSRRPRDDVTLRWLARFQMPLNHPSMMLRRVLPDGSTLHYEPDTPPAEDYDLVARLLRSGKGAALEDVLLKYRVHPAQTSVVAWRRQCEVAGRIARRVQDETLPAHLRVALEPFNRAYFDFEKVAPVEVISAMRTLVAHDTASNPAYKKFFSRQGAQLAAAALTRMRTPKQAVLREFLAHGRDFLAPLAFRYLETRGLRL